MGKYPTSFEPRPESWLPEEALQNASREAPIGILLGFYRSCNRIAREMRFMPPHGDERRFRLRMAWEVEDLLFQIEHPEQSQHDGVSNAEFVDCFEAMMNWRRSRQQARDEQGWDWSSENEAKGTAYD